MQVTVIHTGARDQYQVAASFAEGRDLRVLITSGYLTRSLGAAKRILGMKGWESRKNDLISPWDVDASPSVDLINRIGAYIGRSALLSCFAERRLARHAIRHIRGTDVVICYNYLAHLIFPHIPNRKVLFQCHPNPAALAGLGLSELQFADTGFALEREVEWGSDYRLALEMEWDGADAVIAPSTFVKASLIRAGASEEKISLIPYGCDGAKASSPRRIPSAGKRRLLFVGQLVWRKGADLLPDLLRVLGNAYELTVVTRGMFDAQIAARLTANPNVRLLRDIPYDELDKVYRSSDALLFPSRYEGYGLVINEACSYGVPVISTRYTAMPDIIMTHPIGSLMDEVTVGHVCEAIERLFQNSAAYESASRHALNFARQNTWREFRRRVRTRVKEANAPSD